MHQVKHVAHPHPASHKLPVATAVPIMEQARRSGNYGHLAENILTSMKGPVPVNRKGNVLRGAAPPVSRLASLPVYKKRVMSQDAKDLKDALLDCKRDSDDDCQKMLHLHDKSLAAFERDQDQADSGLFRIFEAAQHIHDARGARPNLARVGMLHELGGSLFPSKSNTDSYGIPNGGSLPGDNV
uniref:Uncharacterized protein n=1 Tax=Hanusia phi TaxID=3032 RepID=A0A7S0HM08_9CRYP